MPSIKIEVEIPNGWVFYTADASLACTTFGDIPQKGVTVALRRNIEDTRKWSKMGEDQRGKIPLFIYAVGESLAEALTQAVRNAEEIGPL